jgi:predicted RNase H-like HicB family nuclease
MSRTLQLTAVFEPAKEGGFTCFFEEMPEVFSEGETIDEARENLEDAFRMMMEFHHDEVQKRVSPEARREILDLALA